MSSLVPFFSGNPSLGEIILQRCPIGPVGIRLLSNALLNRSRTSLKRLSISGNNFGSADLSPLLLSSNNKNTLTKKKPWLDGNRVGAQDGGSRGTQLPTSNLEELYLHDNSMDNESVLVLADSLTKNNHLKVLSLAGNNAITAEGWSAMLNLVCNRSSINDIVNSNHTLNDLGIGFPCRCGNTFSDGRSTLDCALGIDGANLLCAALRLNETNNKMLVARRKILWSHARGDLNLGNSSVIAGVMPRILGWIAEHSGKITLDHLQYYEPHLPIAKLASIRLDSIYRIIQSMPDLCLCATAPLRCKV